MSQTTADLISIAEVDSKGSRDKKMEFMLEQAYSKADIEMKTDINPKERNALTKLQLYSKEFNCKLATDLANTYMILSVSKSRLGRKEWTDIAKSFSTQLDDEGNSLTKRLLGG